MKDNNSSTKFLSNLIIFFLLFFIVFNCYEYLKCFSIVRKMPLPAEQEFLRIKIYGSSNNAEGNTVSGTFSIIDSNGNEIALIERSWSGSYLAVEFDQCKFCGISFIFPDRIYGKEHIIESRTDRKKGTSLEKYYNENRQCMLLGYGSSYKERHQLYQLAKFATKKVPAFSFGATNSLTIDLSPCKTEIYYSIKRDIYGNLFIEEL